MTQKDDERGLSFPLVALAAGTFTDSSESRTAVQGWAELRTAALPEPAEDLRPAALAPLDGAVALVVGLQRLDAPMLEALPASVRVVGRAGIGLDSIDLDVAARLGIAVTHQPDYATEEVATHAVAMLLALSRRLFAGDGAARTAWPSWNLYAEVESLGDSCVGILGLGRIGAAVARRVLPMAGRVVAFDPAPASVVPGVEMLPSAQAVLASSNAVTLHLPLVEATRHLVDQAAIASMPSGALLINVARGGLIDERAVADALLAGHLAGAALDVLSREPPPPDHPLLHSPNTLLSPHAAWISTASQRRLQRWTMESVREVLHGQDVSHGRLAVVGSR